MKNFRLVSSLTPVAILVFVIIGCNMSSANMSSLTTSKDKEGKEPATSFKNGDTIHANATVSNNPGKVKVITYLIAEDAEGVTKGEKIKGSEVTVEIDGDGRSEYSIPVSDGFPAGKYKLVADMMNDAGEKKDSKTIEITIEKSAGSTTTNDDADSDNGKDDADSDDAKDKDGSQSSDDAKDKDDDKSDSTDSDN